MLTPEELAVYTPERLHGFLADLSRELGVTVPNFVIGRSCVSLYDWSTCTVHLSFTQWGTELDYRVIIAHELRHHWQFVNSVLVPIVMPGTLETKGVIWQGNIHPTPWDWHSSPWEVDAVNYENEINHRLGLSPKRAILGNRIENIHAFVKY